MATQQLEAEGCLVNPLTTVQLANEGQQPRQETLQAAGDTERAAAVAAAQAAVAGLPSDFDAFLPVSDLHSHLAEEQAAQFSKQRGLFASQVAVLRLAAVRHAEVASVNPLNEDLASELQQGHSAGAPGSWQRGWMLIK